MAKVKDGDHLLSLPQSWRKTALMVVNRWKWNLQLYLGNCNLPHCWSRLLPCLTTSRSKSTDTRCSPGENEYIGCLRRCLSKSPGYCHQWELLYSLGHPHFSWPVCCLDQSNPQKCGEMGLCSPISSSDSRPAHIVECFNDGSPSSYSEDLFDNESFLEGLGWGSKIRFQWSMQTEIL